jgi:hypothetical protein
MCCFALVHFVTLEKRIKNEYYTRFELSSIK